MTQIYSVVECNTNGTIRCVVQSTFNGEEAGRVKDELTRQGQNNRQYVVLTGEVELPKATRKKAEDAA